MATVVGIGGGRRRRNRRAGSDADIKRGDRLGEILSFGVIPRLMMAHSRPIESAPKDQLISLSDIESIAPIAIGEPAHVLLEQVEAIMQRGVSVEEIFVDLLAPVARQIGELWEDDRLDFLQVSMALWRLQEVLRQVSANTTRGDVDQARSALFAPMPGDQHSFGTAMVHECFTLAGWDADLMLDTSLQRLIEMTAEHRYDLLGLTLSCDFNNDRLTSLIRAVRSVSKNPHICVMVGGRMIIEQPHLVALCGADATAESAPAAVKAADRLVGMLRLAATA